MIAGEPNAAELAAQQSLQAIYSCLALGKSFRLEAGAGSGKTHSLVEALRHLIKHHGSQLIRNRQRVACITYTNIATEQILKRTDRHPVIVASTLHAFFWELVRDQQPYMRLNLHLLPNWGERLADAGGVAGRPICYDLGYPSAATEKSEITLHHNDVLHFAARLLAEPKFQRLFKTRYPILFVDEYQDSDPNLMAAIKTHLLESGTGPLVGLFGDDWQTIYDGCGRVESAALEHIPQQSNFRSVKAIVDVLNKMRPTLPQQVANPDLPGSAEVFHTNLWSGTRRTDSPFKEDLPASKAHTYLELIRQRLTEAGWNFSPDHTKILMLTHNVLAAEQGYQDIAATFKGRSEKFAKGEDPHIKFFMEVVEPVSVAYSLQRYGDMFEALGENGPRVRSHQDKLNWAQDMNELIALRAAGTVGQVIDHLEHSKRPRLPASVWAREQELKTYAPIEGEEMPSSLETLAALRAIPYQQMAALTKFVDEKTLFSTKHGVKGDQFENVLVVAGRGWNNYNFNQLLEWFVEVPPAKQKSFERNRNLFYVACSRPKTRLAVLFTQSLSAAALNTLSDWFGAAHVHALPDLP